MSQTDKTEELDNGLSPASEKPAKIGRFKAQYLKYKAKGKWFLIGFVLFYLIRDTLLYIILPWYLAKGGISLWDLLFGK